MILARPCIVPGLGHPEFGIMRQLAASASASHSTGRAVYLRMMASVLNSFVRSRGRNRRIAWALLALAAVAVALAILYQLMPWVKSQGYRDFAAKQLGPGISSVEWEVRRGNGVIKVSDRSSLDELRQWLLSAEATEFGVSYPGTPCRLRITLANDETIDIRISSLRGARNLGYTVLEWGRFFRIAARPPKFFEEASP